jgi:hypothetical protein
VTLSSEQSGGVAICEDPESQFLRLPYLQCVPGPVWAAVRLRASVQMGINGSVWLPRERSQRLAADANANANGLNMCFQRQRAEMTQQD